MPGDDWVDFDDEVLKASAESSVIARVMASMESDGMT